MDKSHEEQVERWAEYVRTHPRSEWIKHIKPFIDSQIIMANRFYERLSQTPEGLSKIKLIRKEKLA